MKILMVHNRYKLLAGRTSVSTPKAASWRRAAMTCACGKPVVASRLGAIAELVDHERTGLLFEPGNAEDLARQAERLFDPEACDRMGASARAEFEAKYTAGKNYDQLMNIYETAIARRKEKK